MNRLATREDHGRAPEQLAIGLGWFSIALGVAELAAPRTLARLIGVREDDTTIAVLRTFGAREIGTGLAILAQPDNPTALWGRVAGDALDLVSLGAAMTSEDSRPGRTTFAAATVLGVTVLDVMCAQRLSNAAGADRPSGVDPSYLRESITINQPIERVYQAWTALEHVAFLREAQITDAREQESCSWMNNDGITGIVHFERAPGARGTEVRVELTGHYGKLGTKIARVLGMAPDQQVREDLRRFKQLLENGEVTVSDGPGLWRAAQPASNPEQLMAFAHRRSPALEPSHGGVQSGGSR